MVAQSALRVRFALHFVGCGGGVWRTRAPGVLAVAGAAAVLLTSGVMSRGTVPRAAVAHPAARPAGHVLPAQRVLSMPSSAQLVISSAVGRGDPRFAAARSGPDYQLHGGGVSARLGARHVQVSTNGVALSLTFIGVLRGERLSKSPVRSMSAHANRVAYERGPLREWYAAGPLGIEQGFTLARRPAGRTRR